MPWLGLHKLRLAYSDSKAKFPDLWVEKGMIPKITVTAEWASHDTHTRRSQLVHEFLHLVGMNHDRKIGYNTHPEKDVFSKRFYNAVFMNPITSTQILTAFKKFCHSRGYTQKVVGDYRWEEPRKRVIGASCKLWGTENRGEIMNVYDTKLGHREKIKTSVWL